MPSWHRCPRVKITILLLLVMTAGLAYIATPRRAMASAGVTEIQGFGVGSSVPKGATNHQFLHVTPAVPTSASPESNTSGVISPLVAGSSGEELKYHGGPIEHKPELELLFWGNNFWNGTPPSYEGKVSLYTEYKGFYDDLDSELTAPGEASWQGILSQYYGAESGGWGDAMVAAEAHYTESNALQGMTKENALQMINWWVDRGLQQNANTQVIVLTAPGTTFAEDPEGGCGYHGIDDQGFSYSLIAYAGDIDKYLESHNPGYTCNFRLGDKEAETTQLMWSSTAVASHEFAEATTDPGLNGQYAWFSEKGEEVADLCDHSPVNSVELPEKNGRPGWWYVTELWDDEGGNKCSLEDPPSPPPPPPSVTTGNAENINTYQGTLTGTVNPNGPEATYYFEYGRTTSYGNTAPLPNGHIGYGTSTDPVSAVVTGNSEEVVHYRLVASSWAGTSYGADHTFEIAPQPPIAKTTHAREIGPTVATLGGEVGPTELGAGNDTTYFYFEYGPTTSYGYRTTEEFGELRGSLTDVSQGIANLSPNTTYHYRVVGVSRGGITYGSDAIFTTTPSPYAYTEGPEDVTISEATLRGRVNPGGHSTTYQFEYWPAGKSSEVKDIPTLAESVGMGTSTLTVSDRATNLIGLEPYDYRLKATSSLGTTYGETRVVTAWPSFSLEATPFLGAETVSRLKDVACTSADECTAVGYSWSPPEAALVVRWNGTEWIPQSTPTPPGAESTSLEAVSCPSATECMAVGSYSGPGSGHGLALRWNGASWSQEPMPMPSGGDGMNLKGITCVSVTECIAVGDYSNSSDATMTLAEHWNGTQWSVQSTPNEDLEAYNELSAISCTATTACTATGSYTASRLGRGKPMAERWNGSEWTLQTVPVPAGAEGSGLSGVACTSPTSCIAVGSGFTNEVSGPYFPVADSWNGTTWTQMTLPLPAGSEENAFLAKVSCASTVSCVAVGHYFSHGELLLTERWNGSEWTQQSPESKNDTVFGDLYGVSCVSTLTCVIVGYYLHERQVMFAAGQLPPNVTTESASAITSDGATLNCKINPEGQETTYRFEYGPTTSYGSSVPTPEASAGSVTGQQNIAQAITGLKSGTTYHFRIVATSDNGTSYGTDYTFSTAATPSVEAKSATGITAFGATLNGAVNPNGSETKYYFEYGATESYGSKTTEASAGSGTSLTEVSKAVSGLEPETVYHFRLVAKNSGGTVYGPDHTLTTLESVPSVSTDAATSITDVGVGLKGTINPEGKEATYYFEYGKTLSYGTKTTEAGAGSGKTAVEVDKAITGLEPEVTYHYRVVAKNSFGTSDGTDHTFTTSAPTWAVQLTPKVTGAIESVLYRVSCPSTTSCMSVGEYENSDHVYGALAEQWNGTEWKVQTTPDPSGAEESYLQGVSCTSSTFCTATGGYVNSEGKLLSLAERWNGTEWKIQTTPSPSGSKSAVLHVVSCKSSTDCTAVGRYENSEGIYDTLAERWNGTEWQVQATPNPTGAKESLLKGVVCTSSTACTADGYDEDSAGVTVTLAEHWNGTEWKIQTTPNPSGALGSSLSGVSCTSTTVCEANGWYFNSSDVEVTLAERWNGTEWKIQTTPNPAEAKYSFLDSVSCFSSTDCAASGGYESSGGSYFTLAEHWNGTEWMLQTTPNPAGVLRSELEGVACPLAAVCTATGVAMNSEEHYETLVEGSS